MTSQKENLDHYAGAYETTFAFDFENKLMLGSYAALMGEYLQGKTELSILSLGIGHRVVSKALTVKLVGNLKRYTIVEGSKDVIEQFRLNNPDLSHLKIVHSYFEDFIPEERFDAIEMGFVLEHVIDPKRIVESYTKYLTPQGLLFAAVPNALALHRRLGHLAGLLDDPYKLSEADLQLGHKRYFDFDSFRALIADCGLSIQSAHGLYLKPLTTAQLEKIKLPQEVYGAMNELARKYPELSNGMFIVAKKA